MTVDLRPGKEAVMRDFSPSHPVRLFVEGLPDTMDETAFDVIFPTLVKLLRKRCE